MGHAGEAEAGIHLNAAAVEDERPGSKSANRTELQDAGGADCRGPSVGVGGVQRHCPAVVGHRGALGGDRVIYRTDEHAVGTGEHGGVDIQGGTASTQAIETASASAKGGRRVGSRACVGTQEGLARANGPHRKRGGEAIHIDAKGAVEGSAIVFEGGGRQAARGAGVVGECQHGEAGSIAVESDRTDVGAREAQNTAREDGHRTSADGRLTYHPVEHLQGTLVDPDSGVGGKGGGTGDGQRGRTPLLNARGVAGQAAIDR